ncbi:hypothetical protein GOV03_01675 [Candidatus Woesearchaeota archaeon]|nr:hypothetical protein [Candidatus Woesearchaeota archaeon]
MALFSKGGVPLDEVKQLKAQGLSDNQIIDELKGKGHSLAQINDALAQAAIAGPEAPMGTVPPPPHPAEAGMPPEAPMAAAVSPSELPEELHGRIEEIAESIIDEKWDLLVEEVKKIIDWKDKVEEDIGRLNTDVEKLKEDFRELHQGVLGKLESYDSRMTEVGTELKAVGKVFREVVPEFVENVKELKSITKVVKKKKS